VDELELGVTAGIGAVKWGLIFWLLTVLGEIFVVLHVNGILARAKRPRAGTLVVAILVGCVVVPFAGAYAGCAFGAQRGAAEIYDEVDPGRAVEWAIARGVDEVRQELGIRLDDTPIVELEKLRAHAAAQQAGDLRDPERAIETMFWWAVEQALQEAKQQVSWRKLVDEAEKRLKEKVREQLPDYGGSLRKGAWFTLGVFLAALILVNGLAIFLIRRRAAQPPPQQP
jgi:hypothetical protein